MTTCTEAEIRYITTQRLGRLATIQPNGCPQVNPVSCYYNHATGTIDVGGHDMARSQKYRNIQGNPLVAVVIDDMPSRDPSSIRCIEFRGRAEAIDYPTDSAARSAGPIIRIHPKRIISWGIDAPEPSLGARGVQSES